MKNMYKFIKRLTQRLYSCHIEVVYCCKILLIIRIRSEFTIYRLYIYHSISVINNYGLVSSLNQRIAVYPYTNMQFCNLASVVTHSAELHIDRQCRRILRLLLLLLLSSDDLSHLPFLLKFLATVTVALAIRREPVRFLPGTPGPPDAVYVRILVPLATRLMFNSKLCFGAVIRAFALEAIALCSRCIRLLRLFRVGARSGTGTARGARVAALSSQATLLISLIVYR